MHAAGSCVAGSTHSARIWGFGCGDGGVGGFWCCAKCGFSAEILSLSGA